MAIRISHGARSEDAIYNAELPDGTQHSLVTLGRHSYGHEFFVHWEGEACQIEIGRYTSIAHGVRFFAGQEHHTEWGTTYPFTHLPPEWPELRALTGHPVSRGNIVVGSDVWIGYGVLIRSGLSIGHGAVIGMGAVVTRDVPPYAIVAGNPARTVRRRFEPEISQRLLELAWWNWPAEMVRKIAPTLTQPLDLKVVGELEEFKVLMESEKP